MKNLILTLSLISITSVFSQKEVTRTIDWQRLDKINKAGITTPVKNGKFAIFKIKNINKFLFEVSITGSTVDLQTEMPDELQKLFRVKKADQTKQTDNEATEDAVTDAEAAVKLMRIEMNNNLTSGAFLAAQESKLDGTLQNVIDTCSIYLDIAKILSKNIGQAKINRIKLINLAQQDISFTEMREKVAALKISDPTDDYKEMEEIYSKLVKLYIQAGQDATGSPATTSANITLAFDKIKKSYDAIEKDDFLNLYSQVKYLSAELSNEKNFIVVSPPVQMIDDYVNFQVTANPVTTNSLAPHNTKMQFSFDVPSYSGVEVDFSVGPTLSFGKGAKDELFYLEESTTIGKSYLRQRNNNNAGAPGVAAMMHIYDRVANEAALGLLFGVGAGFQSIDDVDLSFYLGGSVILGKKQKVMINTGVSLLRVDRLKEKEFVVGNEYTTQDFDLDNVVEKVFKPSFFISLSYSLTKRVTN